MLLQLLIGAAIGAVPGLLGKESPDAAEIITGAVAGGAAGYFLWPSDEKEPHPQGRCPSPPTAVKEM